MKTLKIIVEKHSDGYVAYPLGLQGAVVAEETSPVSELWEGIDAGCITDD